MNKATRTKQGYSVCRRFDNCGLRISIIAAEGDNCCTLRCGCCGQEYRFRCTGKDQLMAASNLACTSCR